MAQKRPDNTETLASRALSAALTPKMTQAELAELLGVTQQAVSSWVSGRTTPSAEYMRRIEDELGIPMRDWTEPTVDEGAKGAA